MPEKRSVRVSTPFQFPLPPKDASLEASRYFRDLELYIQSLILRLQLPPHTKGANQFLRHDALTEKLTWQSAGTLILAGEIGVDSASPQETVVHTTLVTATSVILLTCQDASTDNIRLSVKTRTVGRNFTIRGEGMTVPRKIGYALFENSALPSGGGSDGTCPLVKTGVVHGSGAFVDGTTIVFTWDPTVCHWTTGTAWQLYDDGTRYFIDTPAVDKFAGSDSGACPPNGVYTQVGGGLPGATITLS